MCEGRAAFGREEEDDAEGGELVMGGAPRRKVLVPEGGRTLLDDDEALDDMLMARGRAMPLAGAISNHSLILLQEKGDGEMEMQISKVRDARLLMQINIS